MPKRKWYIVVVVVEDWYILLQSVEVVKAHSAKKAVTKALDNARLQSVGTAEYIFGPFNKKPKKV